MTCSVESMCNLLARSRLLPAEEVRALYQRWQTESPSLVADPARFGAWLVARSAVTRYQADRLAQGKAGPFVLNDYLLLDRIGHGGMAVVYRARHPLGVEVALKVLPASRATNGRWLARFLREGRYGMRLKHPNVVRTYHAGKTDDLHFIAQEYLEGETLSEVLRRRRSLPVGEAVRIVHQALLGLRHVHEQGVIHRDIKPANLMLAPAPALASGGTTLSAAVKIIDFGLCRPLKDEPTAPRNKDGRHLTQLGTWLGTPDYVSPEQARDAHLAGVPADIYSLGCVLYHCLAGQPPFGDGPAPKRIRRHVAEAPRPVRELNPSVPAELQQVLDGMLAKGLEFRYPTAERVAEALRPFLPTLTQRVDSATVLMAPEAPVAEVLTTPAGTAEQPAPQAMPVAPVVEAPEAVVVPTRGRFGLDRRSTFLLAAGAGLGMVALLLLQSMGWKLPLFGLLGLFVARYLFRYLFRKATHAFRGDMAPPSEVSSVAESAPVATLLPAHEESR